MDFETIHYLRFAPKLFLFISSLTIFISILSLFPLDSRANFLMLLRPLLLFLSSFLMHFPLLTHSPFLLHSSFMCSPFLSVFLNLSVELRITLVECQVQNA